MDNRNVEKALAVRQVFFDYHKGYELMNQLQPLSDLFLDHAGRGKVPTLVCTPYIVPPSRIRDVTGVISRSGAYVLERSDPDFPKRVRLSPGNTGWRYSELIAYIERRAAS